MKRQKLKDYIFENNTKVQNRIIPVFSVTNNKGFIPSEESFNKIVHSKNISNYKEVKPNFFAYNPSRINVGSIALNLNNSSCAVSPMYTVFECSTKYLFPKYLLYFLKSPNGQNEIKNRTIGTVRFQLKFNQLSNISIFLPSILEQQRNVSILDEIDELIQKQKQALELTRQMIPSLFKEMFGDSNKWPIVKLGTISNIIMGQSPPGSSYNSINNGLPFFQGKADFSEIYPIPRKWCTKSIRIANEGDILISVRAPVGPTNIANVKCCIGRGLSILRVNPNQINNYFLLYFLRKHELKISQLGVGSTFKSINRNNINNINIPLPPIRLQNIFFQKAKEIQLLQNQQEKSLKNLEQLFESLLNQFFS